MKVVCEFKFGTKFKAVCFYTCRVKNVIIFKDTKLNFLAEHGCERTNRDVEAIFFENCTISKIPQGLTKIFPYLKMIKINNSNLQSVERDDLKEYRDLTHISLPNNQITYLYGDLFADLSNLEVIWLCGNNIEVIESNLLNGLNELKIVNLKNNPCINKCFDFNKVFGTATLKEIKRDICGNISKQIFDMKNEIRNLKCSNQELQKNVADVEIKDRSLERQIAELRNNDVWNDLKKIIQEEKLKDFTVQVDDEEFKVHKFLLAARSPVLKEMIENNIDAECLKLVNFSKEIFREILHFICTDEPPKSDDIKLLDLFEASGRLKMYKLMNFAADKLIYQVNVENALEILTLANKFDSKNLRQKSFEVLKEYLKEDVKEMSDDLAMQPKKLKQLLDVKNEKMNVMREIDLKLKTILN